MTSPKDIIPTQYEVLKLRSGSEVVGMTRDTHKGIEVTLPMICRLEVVNPEGSQTLATFYPYAALSADATVTISSSAVTNLDTFDKATYRSAKYWISIADATNGRYEIVEANVIHDGSTAYVASFGSTTSYSTPIATFTADISGSDVRLRVALKSSNSTVFKYQRIAIDV